MPTFNLEFAISAWRRGLEHRYAIHADDLDELERHVRDQVASLVDNGMSEEDAFKHAQREFGSYGAAEREYAKVYWGKRRKRGELRRALLLRLEMLDNFLVVALRAMKRDWSTSALNVFGLAVGMAGCLLLICYVDDELQYDAFLEHSDRIFRVTTEEVAAGGTRYAHTFPAAGPALAREMPEVVRATRLLRQGFGNHDVFKIGEHAVKSPEFLYVDSTFFDVFTVSFVEGDRADALVRPNTMVISRDAARTYFGDQSPLGRFVTVPNVEPERPSRTFEIVGVVEQFPPQAHVHFDFLLSLETWNQGRTAGYFDNNWRVLSSYTYLRLRDARDVATLQRKLPRFVEARTGTEIPEAFRVKLHLQRLTDIHLRSQLREEFEPNGDIRHVYIFSTISVFILLIAGINFVNLVTARAARRAPEVGVRKVVGARKSQLVWQFLVESLLLSGAALVLALFLFVASLPAFNSLTGKALSATVLVSNVAPAVSVAVISLLIGLVAGSYPAFILSAFRPALVLKTDPAVRRTRGTIRKGLVIVQFSLSIGLMIATAVMYRQLSYMQHAGLGYDNEHLLVLDYRFRVEDTLKVDALRQELLRHPAVRSVAFGSTWPMRPVYFTLSLRPEGAAPSREISSAWYGVDTAYMETLGLEIIDGGGFSEQTVADLSALLVNEAAVRAYGWVDPIGKSIFYADDDVPLGRVIGVVRDFHYRSLIDPVEPVVMSQEWRRARQPLVKIAGDDRAGALTHLERTWNRLLGDRTFEYTFLDQVYQASYESEERLGRTTAAFALLALTIACLGLFGLATFMTQQRTKEIGIRKVLGATALSIATLLTMDFAKLVSIAFAIAVPATYLAMQRWLSDFSYRIDLSPDLFVMAGSLALVIASLTTGYLAVRAAWADPVQSLRYE